jgi:hypothetical protein
VGLWGVQLCSRAERPDVHAAAVDALNEAWPEFVFHDRVAEELLPAVRAAFADLDVVAMVDGRALAGAWGVPLAWDGDPTTLPDGYDGALRQCLDDRAAGRPQTALVLMAAGGADR